MTTEAFKENVLPLNRKLLGFANRFMQDLDDAKDIVQEIYVKLWNMHSDLDKYNSIEALAMRMTRNLCLDKIKLKKTIPLHGAIKEESTNEAESKEQEAEMKLAVLRAKQAIDSLEEPQKTIMQLRDPEGYDYDEIAQILNMNVNTIRVSLSRARKKIRDLLIEKYYNHGSGKIKALLEKYYKGDTSLNEEMILREYFSHEVIDHELIADKDMFLFQIHEAEKQHELPDLSDELWESLTKNNPKRIRESKKFSFVYLKIAASILVLVGSFFLLKNQIFNNEQESYFSDTYDNPELAYQQAKETLLYVSALLNNGTDHLEPIQMINEGTQNLTKLSNFNKGLNELNPIQKYDLANKYIKQ